MRSMSTNKTRTIITSAAAVAVTVLDGPGAHVHHARGIVHLGAALHSADQVGDGEAP